MREGERPLQSKVSEMREEAKIWEKADLFEEDSSNRKDTRQRPGCGGLERHSRDALKYSSLEKIDRRDCLLCLLLMEIGTEPQKNPLTLDRQEK